MGNFASKLSRLRLDFKTARSIPGAPAIDLLDPEILGGMEIEDAGDEAFVVGTHGMVYVGQAGTIQIFSHRQGEEGFFLIAAFHPQDADFQFFQNGLYLFQIPVEAVMISHEALTQMLARKIAGLVENMVRFFGAVPVFQNIAQAILEKAVYLDTGQIFHVRTAQFNVTYEIPAKFVTPFRHSAIPR